MKTVLMTAQAKRDKQARADSAANGTAGPVKQGKTMKLVIMILLAVLLAGMMLVQGCSNAGPFVTDISSDGSGGLVITKNTAVFDPFLGILRDGNNPIVYTIKTNGKGGCLEHDIVNCQQLKCQLNRNKVK